MPTRGSWRCGLQDATPVRFNSSFWVNDHELMTGFCHRCRGRPRERRETTRAVEHFAAVDGARDTEDEMPHPL